MQVEFDFGGGARETLFDAVVSDNLWHMVRVSWADGVVSVRLDGSLLGFVAGKTRAEHVQFRFSDI